MLSTTDLKMLLHSPVLTHLNYCNVLLSCLNWASLSLQVIQNAPARLLTNTSCRSYITPILASLHWLPIKHRINFKTLLFICKALHNSTPPYISDLLHPYSTSRPLRSTKQGLLFLAFPAKAKEIVLLLSELLPSGIVYPPQKDMQSLLTLALLPLNDVF